MNRRFGFSAGGVALAAFAVHLMLPTAKESSDQVGSRSAVADKPQDQTNANSGDTENSADPADGPWLATRTFFRAASNIAVPHLGEKRIDLYRAADILDCSLDNANANSAENASGLRPNARRIFRNKRSRKNQLHSGNYS